MKSKGYKLEERKTPFIKLFRITPPRTVCPNFYVLAHANGCMFSPQCDYCYLKSSFWYLEKQRAFGNIDDMVEEVRAWIAEDGLETYMLNSGNLSDSLSFEEFRPLMGRLIETFRQYAMGRPHTLLLVTKGGMQECETLFATEPCKNVVVSFSVTNPDAARRLERGAATVDDRMEAAAELKRRGWCVRIRIDPMILGYDYRELAERVKQLGPERVTLGTLRAEHNLPRFVNKGLFDELEPPSYEKGLARYPLDKRLALYRQAVDVLEGSCPIGLCEEEASVWDALGLHKEDKPCNCCV